MVPKVNEHFARFGMEVHEGIVGKDSKSEILFVAAPECMYDDAESFDGVDLSDVDLGNGRYIPVVSVFKYLGSMLTRDCRDSADVDARVKSAGAAFGALRKCIFSANDVWFSVKRAVYNGLVLSILLYGSEAWCLTEVLLDRLRRFHARCVRAMCRVTLKHSWDHHIKTSELLRRIGVEPIDIYISRRQLRWAGHVARMSMDRFPRRMLSSWVRWKRPVGAPQMTYGRGLRKAMAALNISPSTWHVLAQDRAAWQQAINPTPESDSEVVERQGVRPGRRAQVRANGDTLSHGILISRSTRLTNMDFVPLVPLRPPTL